MTAIESSFGVEGRMTVTISRLGGAGCGAISATTSFASSLSSRLRQGHS